MKQKAREAFEHALALDPNHVKTRRLLGYVKVDDTWMTRDRAVRILAPDILSAVKERDLEARKDMEVARTEIAEKQQAIEKLEAQLKALEKANRDLLRRLASIPPPAPVREPSIIYRPYVIYRDRPRPTPHKGDGKGDGSHGSRDSREGNGTKKGTTKKSTKKTSP